MDYRAWYKINKKIKGKDCFNLIVFKADSKREALKVLEKNNIPLEKIDTVERWEGRIWKEVNPLVKEKNN